MSGIAVFNAAVSKLQDSQRNLLAISQARQKMEQEKELFNLQKKKAQLDLDQALQSGKMSELQYDVLSTQNKQYLKQQEDKMKGQIATIKMAEHQNKNVADQALNWAKVGFRSDPQGVVGFLGSLKRNQEREVELKPTFSYGKIGYKEVPVGGEESGTSRATILKEARAMAKDDDDSNMTYEEKIEHYIPIAEDLLSDGGVKRTKRTKKDVEETVVKDKTYKTAPDPRSRLTTFQKILTSGPVDAITGTNRPRKQKAVSGMEFDDKTETLIRGNMNKYGKSREEVITAMKKKGLLIMN